MYWFIDPAGLIITAAAIVAIIWFIKNWNTKK